MATSRTSSWRDAGVWSALVVVGALGTAVAVGAHARLGTAAAPFVGRYSLHLDPASLLAPLVAAAVLAAVVQGWTQRSGWRVLLVSSYAASLAWVVALALVDGRRGLSQPLTRPDGLLPDVARVGDAPLAYLRHFVDTAPQHTASARSHPPGRVLLLWLLDRAGVHAPALLGLAVAALGALTVPLVAVAVRSLCHEPAARHLLPALVLAPWAPWVAVSLDAVTAAVVAGAVACAVVGSEPDRRPWWALAAGLLLGLAALLSYDAPWLAWTVIAVLFVRRRALWLLLAGVAAVVPLLLAAAAGYSWPAGLSSAQAYFSDTVGRQRSWLLWAPLDLLVVVIVCGPLLVTAARKVRSTPGWPFLVGAVLGIGFAVVSGLTRGEAERSFLPFLPWLLVPAVAPDVRPAARGLVATAPAPFPLVVVGALVGIVLEAVVRSPW